MIKSIIFIGIVMVVNSCQIQNEFSQANFKFAEKVIIKARESNESITIEDELKIKEIYKKIKMSHRARVLKAPFEFELVFVSGNQEIKFSIYENYIKSQDEWYKSKFDIEKYCKFLLEEHKNKVDTHNK